MDEAGVGRAVNFDLQTVESFTLPGDTSETRRYFVEDITDPPVVLDAQGCSEVPEGAGFGSAIAPERLKAFTRNTER